MIDIDKDKEQQEQDCCKWIKDYSLEIVLIIIGVGITALAIFNWQWLTGETKNAAGSGYAIRTLVFAYGGLGGLYGLILAARRLRISEAGLFNDRLGRGVEALASKKLHIRAAGVRILENLYKAADLDNQKLIRKLLLDFICNQTDIYDPEKETEPRRWKERVDIEIAIKILGGLVSVENMSLEEKQKELNMYELDLHNLDFSRAKLQGAWFVRAGLQRAQFEKAELQEAQFVEADLQGVQFGKAKLQRAGFWGASLQRAWFVGAELQSAQFEKADLQGAEFERAKLQGANFRQAKLQGASFSEANLHRANLHKADLTGTYLREVENLTQEQLDEAIYEKDKSPQDLPARLVIPKHRAYKLVNGLRIFVESGKSVDLG